MRVCVCSTNLGFSGERIMYQIRMYHTLWYQVRNMYQIRMIPGAYYVPDTYLRTYVVVRMIPTFRQWTHTSDDSYIYQLSLVVATATVSYSINFVSFLRNWLITNQPTTNPIAFLICVIKPNWLTIDQPTTRLICVLVLVIYTINMMLPSRPLF